MGGPTKASRRSPGQPILLSCLPAEGQLALSSTNLGREDGEGGAEARLVSLLAPNANLELERKDGWAGRWEGGGLSPARRLGEGRPLSEGCR
jgi:hypothetical protein